MRRANLVAVQRAVANVAARAAVLGILPCTNAADYARPLLQTRDKLLSALLHRAEHIAKVSLTHRVQGGLPSRCWQKD